MKSLDEIVKDDIKVVLLTTGEEVIGVIEEKQDHSGVEILKPAKMQLISANKVSIVSMIMLGEFDSCNIKYEHIITIVPCRGEAAELWLEKVVDKKPIIKLDKGIVLP